MPIVDCFNSLKGRGVALPEGFKTVADLSPADHLAMQAALQPHVDSAISKTINCPQDISFENSDRSMERPIASG